MDLISFDDFLNVEIRVGTVVRSEPFPEARRPAIKLWVDFGGEIGERKGNHQNQADKKPAGQASRQIGDIEQGDSQIGQGRQATALPVLDREAVGFRNAAQDGYRVLAHHVLALRCLK